ncbi:hypothetical protein AB0N31_33390 [Streptomyces sp. NPDC051051]|uniref:hypothetical protein n=1 Tax=Streptomyces sp. NPDC051051 TaxID=3155666 RepID=UPI00343042F0
MAAFLPLHEYEAPTTAPRRSLVARAAAFREMADQTRIGRRSVRRRAEGMTAVDVAQALEDARFLARQEARHEPVTDDERGRAELAEWERLERLLAAAAPNTVYGPDLDDVVQAELAAEAAATTARDAALRATARSAVGADGLRAPSEDSTSEQTGQTPRGRRSRP